MIEVLQLHTSVLVEVVQKGNLNIRQKGRLLDLIVECISGNITASTDPVISKALVTICADLTQFENKKKDISEKRRQAVMHRYNKPTNVHTIVHTNVEKTSTNVVTNVVTNVESKAECSDNQQVSTTKKPDFEEEEGGAYKGVNNNLNNNFLNSTDKGKKREEVKEKRKEESQGLFENPRTEMKRGEMKVIDGKKVYKRGEGVFFVAPTYQEVSDYAEQMHYTFDIQDFFNFYEPGGWRKGDNTPVRNWKKCCATFESFNKKRTSAPRGRKDFANMKQEEMQFQTIQRVSENEQIDF